jgi:NAD(P)-dependent dehydrogenase (short-subunit alcohol dehydrogenase family)
MAETANAYGGRVVWITGAGGGMGEATARRLAGAGANLVLNDLRAEALQRVAADLSGAGVAVDTFDGDLRDPATSRRTGELIAERHGRLDMLVNCAGFNVPNRRWSQLTPEDASAVIRTNLDALFHTTIVALPFMRARKSGLLVHIASTDGWRVGMTGGPAYSASKHGVVAMSHTINLEEAANGIRSCVICPGGADTGFLDQRDTPPTAEQRARLLRPADIADLIHYIAGAPAHIRFDEVVITPLK